MTDIDWARIARELQAPFPETEIKTKPGRGRQHVIVAPGRGGLGFPPGPAPGVQDGHEGHRGESQQGSHSNVSWA